MIYDVNAVRAARDLPALTWNSPWSNLAFKVAVDFSEGVDVSTEEYLAAKYAQMDVDATALYLDHEITVADISEEGNPVEEALLTIDGGSRMTQTHISIAVYRNDGRVYFAQAVARKIESG